MKNFSQAADNNKQAILRVLERLFVEGGTILEIGSGSGQHAIHMSDGMPSITWQPTETAINLPVLEENLLVVGGNNLLSPLELEVGAGAAWPDGKYQYAFGANVLHIISEQLLPEFFLSLEFSIHSSGLLCLYGPFKYDGEFTTESNALFDVWLKRNYREGGVRDVEVVEREASRSGFKLIHDFSMPANNQLLVFRCK